VLQQFCSRLYGVCGEAQREASCARRATHTDVFTFPAVRGKAVVYLQALGPSLPSLNFVSVLISEFIWLWVNVVVITMFPPEKVTSMPLFAVFKAAVTEAGGIAPETMFSSAVNTCWARFSNVALVIVTPGCRDPVAFRTV
jgi:hypothetical protein